MFAGSRIRLVADFLFSVALIRVSVWDKHFREYQIELTDVDPEIEVPFYGRQPTCQHDQNS